MLFRYEGQLAELSEALEFIDSQTCEDGPWALIALELEAFRASNQRTFRNVQELFQGSAPGNYVRDPEAEKAAIRAEEEEEAAERSGHPLATKKNTTEEEEEG